MTKCAIKVCRNYKGRVKNPNDITFHRIPIDVKVKKAWVEIVRKSRKEDLWVPAKSAVICSEHFKEKDFVDTEKRRRLKKEAIPSKALFLSSVKSDESENSDQDDPLSREESSATLEDSLEPSISRDVQPPASVVTINCDEADVGDFSDLEPLFDSPKEAKLRKALCRKIVLEKKHRLKIQCLRRKNLRLKKKIAYFKNIIKTLKENK